jgi:NAD(P) transhydrogenase
VALSDHPVRNRQGLLQGDRSRSDSRRDRIVKADISQLPGVHIIGEGASELIHIGQEVLSFGGTIDYFIETVFNYPTLAECYKVAAFDGINRLGIFEPDPAEIPQTG